MSLVPKIKVCISKECNFINLYENTGINNPLNTSGWGSPNINTDDITYAEVLIKNQMTLSPVQTIILKDTDNDVYTPVVGSPTPGPFLAKKKVDTSIGDGIFEITYNVHSSNQTGDIVYTSSCFFLNICEIQNCLNKLKKSILGECDVISKKNIKIKIDQLEIIIYGIKSAFSCKDFTTAHKLIEGAEIICDNLCGCGCGDC